MNVIAIELAQFTKGNGYEYEATYIQTMYYWYRACDEYGLSALTRCKYSYQFLNLILDKPLPWLNYDFGPLEVNK